MIFSRISSSCCSSNSFSCSASGAAWSTSSSSSISSGSSLSAPRFAVRDPLARGAAAPSLWPLVRARLGGWGWSDSESLSAGAARRLAIVVGGGEGSGGGTKPRRDASRDSFGRQQCQTKVMVTTARLRACHAILSCGQWTTRLSASGPQQLLGLLISPRTASVSVPEQIVQLLRYTQWQM